MMNRIRRLWRNEHGVAMPTVLFIGASLAVLASSATFVSIEELRTGTDDTKSAQSLAYAEAGVDRMILELRRGNIDFGDVRLSGCSGPTVSLSGAVGDSAGTFDARLEVYPLTPEECTARNSSVLPRAAEVPLKFAITSTGRQPTARRVVRQIIGLRAIGLPIGIYADSVTMNGNPDMNRISLLSPGDITGRDKLGFVGLDAYYKLSNFWPSLSSTTAMPASVHAAGAIYCGNLGGATCTAVGQEHSTTLAGATLNCDANNARGTLGQSQWDQSGSGGSIASGSRCAGQASNAPPTSFLNRDGLRAAVPYPDLTDQDLFMLRDAAKESGIYCSISSGGTQTCSKAGQAWSPSGGSGTQVSILNGDLAASPTPRNKFVAFFDFVENNTANEVDWRDSWPSTSPLCDPDAANRKSVIIVIRNGNFAAAGTTQVNGALFVPQGDVRVRGTFTFNGSVRALRFDDVGTATFRLDDCWVNNMLGPFMDVTTFRWSEIDR